MKVIYNRTSTDEQNPENQLKDCKSMISGQSTVFQEQISAWKDNIIRPEFNKIKNLIKNKQVTDLYVWDLDRLYRNRIKVKNFFEFCKAYNCQIHSFRQVWLEDIHKIPNPWNEIVYDLLINVMGWIAEDESTKKSQRVKSAIRKKRGKTYSYKGNKWGRESNVTYRLIQEVLELKAKGESIREIAKKVYIYDKNRNKKNISKSLVHKILSDKSANEFVKGGVH